MSEQLVPPNDLLIEAIDQLCAGTGLTADQARSVLLEIMGARVNESQTAAFLIALRAKGETAAELAGLASAMRELSTAVASSRKDLVDTAGTGGGPRTFNVSTTAALIAAGAGCAVAKHGNRSATSLSGSADLLEALGVNIGIDAHDVGRCIDHVGFGFMFAPAHHPATKHVVPVRKDLGTRTVFNLLGPLTNPAGARRQVIGVSDPTAAVRIADALLLLGAERALVIHGDDGFDELSICAASTIYEVRDGSVTKSAFEPGDVGIGSANPEEIAGGTPDENAQTTRDILAGQKGPKRDFAVLNAAAAIQVAADGVDLAEAVVRAQRAIDDGAAQAVLEALVSFTSGVSQ